MNSNTAKQGTQTFLIECNRGNSVIDATAPDSNNAKWTTKTDFQFKRGDRVGVEAIMIESVGAGSSQQTIEFSGENIKKGDQVQDWTDDQVILEFGFYVNNNGEKTINLPLKFKHNIGAVYAGTGANPTSLRINSGKWIDAADVVAGTPAATAYSGQFPGISPPAGWAAATAAGSWDGGGYNVKMAQAGAQPTAYDLYACLNTQRQPIAFPIAQGTAVAFVVLSKTGDPNPNANILTDRAEQTIPIPTNYNMSGWNTPFAAGLNCGCLLANGNFTNFGFIENLEPNFDPATQTYDGRLCIKLDNVLPTQDIITAANLQVFPLSIPADGINNGGQLRSGFSANPVNNQVGIGVDQYFKGARIGIGLYNNSAPNNNGAIAPANTRYNGMINNNCRMRGGAFLWEQTRVWGAVAASQVPALGCSSLTTDPANGMRDTETLDLRNYKDNQPYILVSPEYSGPQPCPNGQYMMPKLEYMTAYVIIKASSSFEDVNNLAEKFTEAFHAINPLVMGSGAQLQKYLDNQQFPFNKENNTYPLVSTGYFSGVEGAGQATYSNETAALWNRVSPLWIGNLIKCIPANLTTGIDWKNQPGAPYYYLPDDDKDYLKTGINGDFNWCNLIYGNMGIKDARKCWAGDRFIRTTCWDGNTQNFPHRDIPRPVILNTQIRIKPCGQPGSPFQTPANFAFDGANWIAHEMVFTNIEYTEANLDIIQECFRYNEKYQVQSRFAVNGEEQQQLQPIWEYEMDVGMSDGSKFLQSQTATTGIMTPVFTNWEAEFPATAGANGPEGAFASGDANPVQTPSQSYPGNGSEISYRQARDTGRIQVFSRWFDEWDEPSQYNNSAYGVPAGAPINRLEPGPNAPAPYNYQLGSQNAFCFVRTDGEDAFYLDQTWSRERNIGVIQYAYNDEDGVIQNLCAFVIARNYEPTSSNDAAAVGFNVGRATWELGAMWWGAFFGWSPNFGYDNPAVLPANPDNVKSPLKVNNNDPALKWRWNNQNYVWVGANDAAMVFDNENNRFTLSGLYTEKNLSKLNATIPASGNIPANETQLGESMAVLNTDTLGTKDFFKPHPVPANYNTKNTGVEDSITGVFLNNIYFAPKGWKPPQGINPQNIYSPYVGFDETGAGSFVNQTTKNREDFLKGLTLATKDNWTGNMMDKMGFDYEQLIPPYGSQTNRYSQFTYGRDDIEFMYNGKKPLMLNAETDTAADLDLNVFTYNATTNPTAGQNTADGTPLYTQGLLNNNPLNLGNMSSAKLTATRIPTLFACPFYLVISDICPTQFQSGSFKQDCIFYGLKNYGAGQYFYVFGSQYSQLVDTDRTITQVNTEIRNPLTGRLARLSKNSCIIYKVERDISLPEIDVDATGNLIPEQEAVPDEDENAGIMKELKKLVSLETGEKAELATMVKDSNKISHSQTSNHDVLNSLKKLLQRSNKIALSHQGHNALDFGGLRDQNQVRITQAEARQIAEQEINMEEEHSGHESKAGDRERSIEARMKEIMETEQGEGGGALGDVVFDRADALKDAMRILLSRSLQTLPITTGFDGNILNRNVITTGLKNAYEYWLPAIEEQLDRIERGEINYGDLIRTLTSKNVYLGVKGQIIQRRRRTGKALEGHENAQYLAEPTLIDDITDDLLGDAAGRNVYQIVNEGIDDKELKVVSDAGEVDPDILKGEVDRRIKTMKAYKHQKYSDRAILPQALTLAQQDAEATALQITEDHAFAKGTSQEEKEEFYQTTFLQVYTRNERAARKDPAAYIRAHAKEGEGMGMEQMAKLTDEHREAEKGTRRGVRTQGASAPLMDEYRRHMNSAVEGEARMTSERRRQNTIQSIREGVAEGSMSREQARLLAESIAESGGGAGKGDKPGKGHIPKGK